MKIDAKLLRGVSALFLAGLALGSLPTAAAAQEKVLKWAYQSDIQDLDPYGTTSAGSSMLINVYETLVRRNAKMELEPSLATSWELVEPTRWRFHLRQGVKFHNGNDFNADDVIFSYQRVSDKSSWIRDRVAMVDHIEKIDDYTLDFVTKQPNPIVPNIWTGWMIMDKEWSEQNGAQFPTNLVENKISYAASNENGSGPFRVTYRENGVRTEFEPFEGWWGEKQHNLDRVVFTPITQDGTRVAALLSGEIDMMYPVPVQDIKRIESSGKDTVLSQPELRTIYFGFDQFRDKALETDTPTNPFKDVRVRKAIYQAIDVEGIKTRIMDGMSEPARTLISPILFPKAYEIERYPFDPEASRKLLAEAGYPNGFSTKIDCYVGRYVNDDLICQAMVTMLARVGIKAKLYLNPPTAMGKVIGRPNQTIAIYQLGWTPAGLDSYNVLYNLMSTWNPETGAGRINNGDFSNKRIDEITALVESETDTEKRDALILEAYKIVHDNVYYVPLHHQNVTWAVRKGVSIEQRPDDQFDYRTVRIED